MARQIILENCDKKFDTREAFGESRARTFQQRRIDSDWDDGSNAVPVGQRELTLAGDGILSKCQTLGGRGAKIITGHIFS